MNIYAYDIETTGLSKTSDRPVQFAACVYDEDMILLQATNLRGRLPRYVLPSPDALLVTRKTVSSIQREPLSHYEFMKAIADNIYSNSPTIMMSYNGINFDDEILRHSFYANLIQPYLTQTDGNLRFDVLIAARAAAACAPGSLNLPMTSEGKSSFRLEQLAPANGFVAHDAHDAMGDVQATMHIAIAILERAPEVWRRVQDLRSKHGVLKLMRSGEPLVIVNWDYDDDRPSFRAIVPMTPNEENLNEWFCIGLDANISMLRNHDSNSLEEALKRNRGRELILRVKVNAMPILFSMADAAALNLPVLFDAAAAEDLKSDAAFAARISAAAGQIKARFPKSTEVWDMLYSGGFFPVNQDKSIVDRFHRASPHEKWELLPDLSDHRARTIGRWLIGSEWPEVLGAAVRRAIEDEFRDHLMQTEAKWTTIPSALARIDLLSPEVSAHHGTILEDYRSYLHKLRDAPRFVPTVP